MGERRGEKVVDRWMISSAGGRAGGRWVGGGWAGGGWIRRHSKDSLSLSLSHSNALTVVEVPALVVVGLARPCRPRPMSMSTVTARRPRLSLEDGTIVVRYGLIYRGMYRTV